MNNTKKTSAVMLSNSNKSQLKNEAFKWATQAKQDSKRWTEMINKKHKLIQ